MTRPTRMFPRNWVARVVVAVVEMVRWIDHYRLSSRHSRSWPRRHRWSSWWSVVVDEGKSQVAHGHHHHHHHTPKYHVTLLLVVVIFL